jgi:hypothetical protein
VIVMYAQGSVDLESNRLVQSRGKDGQWTRSEVVGPGAAGSFRNFVRLRASETDDRVWAVFYDAERGIVLARSGDAGATWPEADRVAVATDAEGATVSPPYLDLAVRGDDVYVMYGLSRDPLGSSAMPKLGEVRLARSRDGGRTIAERTSIADAGAGKFFLTPRIAIDGEGAVHAAYYAGNAPADAAASYRRAVSRDGGATFEPSVVVRSPLVFETSRLTDRTPGDYMGLFARGNAVYGSYTDTSAAKGHINFYRVAAR